MSATQDEANAPVAAERLKIVGWARAYPALQPSFSKSLRRGAWYPVVKDQAADRVSIKMGSRTVDVPRRLLEIRTSRPTHFSVVNRVGYQRETGRRSQYNLGKQYGVCPACSSRFALWGSPERTQCPQCRHEGEIGWWEA